MTNFDLILNTRRFPNSNVKKFTIRKHTVDEYTYYVIYNSGGVVVGSILDMWLYDFHIVIFEEYRLKGYAKRAIRWMISNVWSRRIKQCATYSSLYMRNVLEDCFFECNGTNCCLMKGVSHE